MIEPDVNRLYGLLGKLLTHGFERYLLESHGRMQWPSHGVYFFFDDAEKRHEEKTPRVVRVGTHALADNAMTSLWGRLRQHKGTEGRQYAGGGSHRASVFRKHVGHALIARDGHDVPTWGTTTRMRSQEHPLELEVSAYIRSLPFLYLEVNNIQGVDNARSYIESNSIALLSHSDNPDSPSEGWLGWYRGVDEIVNSGLWNVRHVGSEYDPAFLDHFESLVNRM